MEHLTNRHGDPLFPQDTKERVYEQCRTARNILLKVYNNVKIRYHQQLGFIKVFLIQIYLLMKRWMPEVAMAFVTLRESWRALVPMKRRESLAQVTFLDSIN